MKTTESRKNNSIKNMGFAVGAYVITVLLAFVERRFLVRSLSGVYVGVSGVMTNVMSILAISELGFGEALMFSLYKPIRENDENRIVALLRLYKKTYLIISIIIVVASIVFAPFLPSFVKNSDIPLKELYCIFYLYVLNTLVSYFGASRRSLIIAYQKRFIVSATHCICRAIMYIAQIIFLVSTHNYFLYLIISICATLAEGLILYVITGKKYRVVKRKDKIILPSDNKKEITKKIVAMAMHKIGGTLVTSTDNLLISRIIGVVEVGLFSNYILLKTTIYTVTHSLFKAVIASMGDLGNDRKDYAEKIFSVIYYASGWLFGWCSICLLCLYDDFISLWLGSSYVLDRLTVILIVISFYLTCMREPVIMTRDAFGLFWKDRWKPVAEAIINLVTSIVFASFMGLSGIVLGTIVSTLLTCFWIEPLVLYKYGFDRSCKKYFIKYLMYVCITLLAFLATYGICKIITQVSIVSFVIKMIVCIVVPNVIFSLLTLKTDEFKYLYNGLITRMKKKIGGKHQ